MTIKAPSLRRGVAAVSADGVVLFERLSKASGMFFFGVALSLARSSLEQLFPDEQGLGQARTSCD